MRLTDEDLLTAPYKAKPYKIYDGRGLLAEIPTSGHIRWRLKYRFGGKEKKLSLGVYPTVSIEQARARCEQMRDILEKGIDPGVELKEIKGDTRKKLHALTHERRHALERLYEAYGYAREIRDEILRLREELTEPLPYSMENKQ